MDSNPTVGWNYWIITSQQQIVLAQFEYVLATFNPLKYAFRELNGLYCHIVNAEDIFTYKPKAEYELTFRPKNPIPTPTMAVKPTKAKLERDYDHEMFELRQNQARRLKKYREEAERVQRVEEIGHNIEAACASRKQTAEQLAKIRSGEYQVDWKKVGYTAATQIGSAALAVGIIAVGAPLVAAVSVPAFLGLNYLWLKEDSKVKRV